MGELSTNYPSSLVILESEKQAASSSSKQHEEEEPEEEDCGTPTGILIQLDDDDELETTNGVKPFNPNPTIMTPQPQTPCEANTKLKELCVKARFARCRARFPVPVILFGEKHICRSATLSGGPEIYGRSSLDYFFSAATTEEDEVDDGVEEISTSEVVRAVGGGGGSGDWALFDRVRAQDIRLLKSFRVHTIVDLMVEKKKVKFGMK
jgi:hypothetical protein